MYFKEVSSELVRTIELQLHTQGNLDTKDITDEVQSALGQSGLSDGIVNVFVPGSTAGLTTIEFESGAVADLAAAIERIAPKDLHYAHNARWGDGNGHSHVRAAMIGPSLTVPFSAGRLILGTWQQIVLVDFDNRERQRKVICQVLGE
jgi:secondary thiamine-phosphate synthase enzyme